LGVGMNVKPLFSSDISELLRVCLDKFITKSETKLTDVFGLHVGLIV